MEQYTFLYENIYNRDTYVIMSLNMPRFANFVLTAIKTIADDANIVLNKPKKLLKVFKRGLEDPDIAIPFENRRYSSNSFIKLIPDDIKQKSVGNYYEDVDIPSGNVMNSIVDESLSEKTGLAIAKLTVMLYLYISRNIYTRVIAREYYGNPTDYRRYGNPQNYKNYGYIHFVSNEDNVYTFKINNFDSIIMDTYGLIPDIYTNYVDNLPENIKKSIIYYTNINSSDINTYLRYGKAIGRITGEYYEEDEDNEEWTEKVKEYIANIDEAFLNAPPLEESITVYRGQKRKIYDAKSYTSTSLDLKTALDPGFISKENWCCMYVITVAPGSKILSVVNISHVSEENEIILDRGGAFFITNVEMKPYDMEGKEQYLQTIYLTYLPPNSQIVTPEVTWDEDSDDDYDV